ncbi:sensor histidine kinase [Vogesella fluminis]|uniref:sensor histidine kinase n=1 Tax=Vogesella fluminis TaxID=1069161 RepID=UPI00363FDDF1
MLILSNTERAANLIQSFKQVAVDQTSEARRQFDIAHYIGEIITSLRPRLRHRKVEIDIDCLPELQMDSYPGALSQVLTNLVMNALLHAYDDDAEGRIRICVDTLAGQKIRLSVTDDGKGIPPENLKRIFEPFFTTRRGDGGSGLGLHIVFNIVFKRLGGTIRVDSTVGEGTSFILVLPCTAPETAN